MRVWLAGSPWRLTGAWLALAGLGASAGLRVLEQPVLTVLLAVLLADPVWGALWAQITGFEPVETARQPNLPYACPGSPAARLAGWYRQAPVLVIAGVGAWLLGPTALILTAIVFLLALVAAVARRANLLGWIGWLQALVQVTLPFGLGVTLAGPWPDGAVGLRLAGLALGLTLLGRSGHPASAGERPEAVLFLAGLGSALVAAVMLAAGRPILLGLVVLLAAGPLLILARSASAGRSVQFWWWLLALLASAGLGLGIA